MREDSTTTPACKVIVKVAECERFPLAPATVTVKLPVGAVTAAPKTTGALLFAAKLNGPGGFDCTPLGNPLSATCTDPAKPF